MKTQTMPLFVYNVLNNEKVSVLTLKNVIIKKFNVINLFSFKNTIFITGYGRRAYRYRRHEKKWMKRKRLKSLGPIKRDKEKVTGLLNWIVWRKARGLDIEDK